MFFEFSFFPLSSLLHFRLTLSARPPVLNGDNGAMRGGDEGGGSFSPMGCWRGAPEAPAIRASLRSRPACSAAAAAAAASPALPLAQAPPQR